MTASRPVFLFDVDNTLLDNDRVIVDLRDHLESRVGHACASRYWEIFEQQREQLGYADYLGALQRYRLANLHEPHVLEISTFLLQYPFASRLFPRADEVLHRANAAGLAVILSDGDVVFQPHKIHRSGLFDLVAGRVLIYVHKEVELDDVARRFPADHHVVIDDKLRILASIKASWRNRVTTIFVRQGHYAQDPVVTSRYPPADVTIDCIGDFLALDLVRDPAAPPSPR